MPYIPNSPDDIKAMLKKIGTADIHDLFKSVPEKLYNREGLKLPEPLAEPELMRHLEELAEKNNPGRITFAGGGIYRHYIPPVVWSLVMRPEFVTAYTPYQAEVAQGTLQVIYEFQTHWCRLTGLDVANASLYDGATAVAEAAMLAMNQTGRNRIVVSESINPLYREVLSAVVSGREIEIVTIPLDVNVTDYGRIREYVDDKAACLILGQPNFFGYLEEIEAGEKAIHEAGGLLVMAVDPISLGALKPPADYGADIAVAEGQSLGIPQNFGGPLLGMFAARQKFVRKIPGRLVGRTVDTEGKTGFVLTLQTREQHIRRSKATSNICTSEALCATAATIYLSLMGKQGLPRVAQLSTERAHYLADKASSLEGFEVWNDRPFFKEFVLKTPLPPKRILGKLASAGITGGIDLKRFFPKLDHHLLVAVTEMNSYDDCDRFVDALAKVAAGEKLPKVTV